MKYLLLIISVLLTDLASFAGDTVMQENPIIMSSNKGFYLDKQLEVYRFNPSDLWLWENGDFSNITFNVKQDDGDYKTVDQFTSNKQLTISSESVQTYQEAGWRFYGKFTYIASNNQDADWNLSFKQSEVGNPFRLLTKRNGDFTTKSYRLSGIMSKQITPSLSLGIGVDYFGDLYFRMVDTRNEIYNLSIETKASLSYLLRENSYLSLGIGYFYKKSAPKFANNFLPDDVDLYKLYLNKGMDSFTVLDLSATLYFKDNNPKYSLSYFSGEKNKFTLQYSFYSGKERWENKITSTQTDTKKIINQYEYFQNKVLASYLIQQSSSDIFNWFEANYIVGTGYLNQSSLEKNFIYEGLNMSAATQIKRSSAGLFHLNTLKIDFEHVSKKDMFNAQQMDYNNIFLNLHTAYLLNIKGSSRLNFELKGSYKHNLSFVHNDRSGSILYVNNIGYNELAYHTSNYYKLGGRATWNFNYKKTNTDVFVEYQYLCPTEVNFNNQYSILTENVQRTYLEAGINIYF